MDIPLHRREEPPDLGKFHHLHTSTFLRIRHEVSVKFNKEIIVRFVDLSFLSSATMDEMFVSSSKTIKYILKDSKPINITIKFNRNSISGTCQSATTSRSWQDHTSVVGNTSHW